MYGYIYKICNLITNKIYIGRTTKTIEERFSEHCRVAFNDNIKKKLKIQNSIKKYGKENFTLDLLEACETKELYDIREQYYIELYDARNPNIGYNIHEGGEGGITYIGKKQATEKQLKSLEAGRHLPASDKQKEQLRKRRTGIQVSEETREKLRLATLSHDNATRGRVWIYDGSRYKRVLPEDIAKFESQGWIRYSPRKQSKS